jgi:PAS domain-containing protein
VELEMQNEELRRSQLELEESRKKYSDLYDLAPVGYATLDRKGDIQEINLTGAALVGGKERALKEAVLRPLWKSPSVRRFISFAGVFLKAQGEKRSR